MRWPICPRVGEAERSLVAHIPFQAADERLRRYVYLVHYLHRRRRFSRTSSHLMVWSSEQKEVSMDAQHGKMTRRQLLKYALITVPILQAGVASKAKASEVSSSTVSSSDLPLSRIVKCACPLAALVAGGIRHGIRVNDQRLPPLIRGRPVQQSSEA